MATRRTTRGVTACRAWRQSAAHPASNRCAASLCSRRPNATAQRGLRTRTAPSHSRPRWEIMRSSSAGGVSHFSSLFPSFFFSSSLLSHLILIIIQLPPPLLFSPSLFFLSFPFSPSILSLSLLLLPPTSFPLLFNIPAAFYPRGTLTSLLLPPSRVATYRSSPWSACGWTLLCFGYPTRDNFPTQGMIRLQSELLSSSRLQNRCELTNGTISQSLPLSLPLIQ